MTQAKADAKTKRRRRAGTKGGLAMIAVLLLGSAALRLGHNAGQAFALASDDMETPTLDSASVGHECDAPGDLKPILEAFQQRENHLSAQESALRDRMHALKIADDKVSQKLAALTEAEEALRQTMALAESAAEGDLARLTKVYETMKPKQAAALFEEMTPEFAAGFLGRMRPDAAAAILAGLSPEVARTFSVVLAGRNANVPKK